MANSSTPSFIKTVNFGAGNDIGGISDTSAAAVMTNGASDENKQQPIFRKLAELKSMLGEVYIFILTPISYICTLIE